MNEEELDKIVKRVMVEVIRNKSLFVDHLWEQLSEERKVGILMAVAADLRALQVKL